MKTFTTYDPDTGLCRITFTGGFGEVFVADLSLDKAVSLARRIMELSAADERRYAKRRANKPHPHNSDACMLPTREHS